jgi:tetratricopeptide (TPR) repeat protein
MSVRVSEAVRIMNAWAGMIRRFAALTVIGLALSACATADTATPALSSSLYGNYLAARHAAATRDISTAAEYYGRALYLAPANTVLLERSFVLDVTDGRIARAEERARALIERGANDRLARLVLAVTALERNRPGEALAQVRGLSRDDFSAILEDFVVAWSHAELGNRAAALAVFNDPMRREDELSALQTFHTALINDLMGHPEEANAAYSSALMRSGGTATMVQAYGSFLARQGRTDSALSLFNEYLELSQGHPVIEAELASLVQGRRPAPMVRGAKEGVALALYEIAGALVQRRSLDVPAFYLRLAMHLDPDYAEAYLLLGELMEVSERWKDAAEIYAAVPRASPLWPTALTRAAVATEQMGDTQAAKAMLRDYLRRHPGNLEARITLGDIYRANSRFTDAAATYEQALAEVKAAAPRHWSLYYTYGIALERSGRWDDAERAFKRALELAPDEPRVLNYLGYSWIDQGVRLDEALGMIKRAVEQRPDDGYIVDSLGWGYYRLGKYEEAVQTLERAVELSPADPVINDHLGDAYWRVGRTREAYFQWRHALALDPEDDLRAEIERKMREGLGAPGLVN